MSGDLTYSYKAALFSAPWEFQLKEEGLEWRAGRHTGLLRYDRIRCVRLSFRPVTLQSHRFLAEIWSEGVPKILIASTTWRSIVEQKRQDEGYAAFIIELHRRMVAAGVPAQFLIGMPGVVYWLGLAVFVAVALGLAALTVRALQVGEWAGAAFVGGFFVLFVWQLGGYFRRNRPGTYRPDELPASVLPRAKA
jgi:hypothetical protein